MTENMQITAEDIFAGNVTSFRAFGHLWWVKYVTFELGDTFGYRIVLDDENLTVVSRPTTQHFLDGLPYTASKAIRVGRNNVRWVGDNVYIPHTHVTIRTLVGGKVIRNLEECSFTGIITCANDLEVTIGSMHFGPSALLTFSDSDGNPVGICLDTMPPV